MYEIPLITPQGSGQGQMSMEETFNTFLLQCFYPSCEQACREHVAYPYVACDLPLTETMQVKPCKLSLVLNLATAMTGYKTGQRSGDLGQPILKRAGWL